MEHAARDAARQLGLEPTGHAARGIGGGSRGVLAVRVPDVAALLAVPYLLNVLRFSGVTDTDSGQANAGWKTFLWLNYLTGFLVTMLLIWWAAVRPV